VLDQGELRSDDAARDTASATHVVVIPSYNPGPRGLATVQEARHQWNPVWVVVDGSDDGSRQDFERAAEADPGIRVLVLERNRGKGAAILHALRIALAAGFTHALTMDSDGQHPADRIRDFMAASLAEPRAMILGAPCFADDAPRIRVQGRKLSNLWTHIWTLGIGVPDSLFGFRVYPVAPLVRVMNVHPWMRRFDFDAEAAVRLCWLGVRPLALPAKVRYFRKDQGGVSHFHYLRDNVLLTWMHTRLLPAFLVRLPLLLARRLRFL
jgi:glycosyltransferase involved in cell wall biosynthesis